MSHPVNAAGQSQATSLLTGEFELNPELALSWVDGLLTNPPTDVSALEYVDLIGWRRGLASTVRRGPQTATPPMPTRGRMLLDSACRQATSINPDWANVGSGSPRAGYAAQPGAKPTAIEKLPHELWEAIFGLTNLPGTVSQTGLLVDSLLHSLPLAWRVKVQGGTFELYDANSSARRHAFGKDAKLKYPPRMKLRVRGAKLSWLPPKSHVSGGIARIPTPRAKNVSDAIRIARANMMKLVPQTAFSSLPLRGFLGSNAFGIALTIGPQAIKDASDTGVLANPTSAGAWKDFAVASARSQSANVAGVLFGLGVGAAAAILVTSAPALILIGMAAGATGQALFNAVGASENVADATKALFE
jgi:hypothetical protein